MIMSAIDKERETVSADLKVLLKARANYQTLNGN